MQNLRTSSSFGLEEDQRVHMKARLVRELE